MEQTLLAVRLLDQVTAAQARRVTTTSRRPDLGILSVIMESDVPEYLYRGDLCGLPFNLASLAGADLLLATC